MLDKTKAAVMAEITELGMCVDPAPMPGTGTAKIAKALAEDLKDLIGKSEKDEKCKH